ncbi:MAG: GNAT family acetyltransferase [Alphaproteobacteria bacterium]
MVEPVALGPDLRIRTYRDGDRKALIDLWDRCGLLVSYNDPVRDIALWQASNNAEIFVGELDGGIVASVCVGHDGHRGNPYYVAVDPTAQKGGLGRRMMRHAEEWLARLGIPKMNIMVRKGNERVHAFYHAIGYKETPRAVYGRWLTTDGQPVKDAKTAPSTISSTVTYLEMTARPSLPPTALSSRRAVALLRANQPSVAFYRFLYDSIGKPWMWYERLMLDDEALATIIQDEKVEIYVLYVDGVPAGYAELDRRQDPDIELAYLGLVPEFVGGGLGAYLLATAIDIAWSYEPRRLWVHTCTQDHPRALALYQQFGFKPYKQESITFPDPRLSGLIPAES